MITYSDSANEYMELRSFMVRQYPHSRSECNCEDFLEVRGEQFAYFGVFLDELRHQVLAFPRIKYDYFHSPLTQQILSSEECLILADHDTRYLVQQNSTSTHVARALIAK